MDRSVAYLVLSLSLLVPSTLVSAYAEVASLKTNAAFYTPATKIYFTGTVPKEDVGKAVYLAIHDPTGKFINPLQGTMSNADGTFAFTITPDQQFSAKGIYNASAFIAIESAGQATNFIFSPDGSPIVSTSPIGLTAVSRSSTEIDLSWSSPTNNGGSSISGYRIERNDGSGFIVIQNTQTTAYQDTSLTPSKQYSYRVSAINSAGVSNPSSVVYSTTLSAQTQTTNNGQSNPTSGSNNDQSVDKIIQQRIEAAKKLKELLNQQNGRQLHANLYENLGVSDLSATLTGDSSGQYDFNNALYPLIALGGVGIVVAILYSRKRFIPQLVTSNHKKIEIPETMPSSGEPEDDYALMILRNRLAKGEITVQDYKSVKDALDEP
ncbi:MAG: fibronectin type III domain-containing protein [Thaumarchaeota archaeon]|nr:MAG: fibronectin type III domain-containing protein [Nitrososphaerota archaeon]